MKYIMLGKDDSIVYIENEEDLITDIQSSLDLIMTIKYETGCSRIILDKKISAKSSFGLAVG